MPPARDQRGVLGDIFLPDKSKARLLYHPLVDSGRHEQKETDGAADRQFVVGYRPGDHDRIGEDGPTAGAEDAVPFLEYGKPVRKMIHRVDTEKPIERVLLERQAGIGVGDGEPDSSVCRTPPPSVKRWPRRFRWRRCP